MHNLSKTQMLLAKVAATATDHNPRHCALMRATNNYGLTYFEDAERELDLSTRETTLIAAGWDSVSGGPVWSQTHADHTMYKLGQQAYHLIFGAPAQ